MLGLAGRRVSLGGLFVARAGCAVPPGGEAGVGLEVGVVTLFWARCLTLLIAVT